MSAPSAPADNSLQVAQLQAQQAKDAQTAQDQKDAQAKSDLAALRNSSYAGGQANATRYFQDQGLDPTQYSNSIDDELNSILAGISPTDQNPGTYFKNAGQDIYQDLTTRNQNKLTGQVNQAFAPTYATDRIQSTLDDPYLASTEASQRANADAIIKNMLDRGVLTATGAATAGQDLDRQESGVKLKLQGYGDSILAGGQQSLNDVINKAKQTASTVQLGQTFDPTNYTKQADQVYNDFIASLPDAINAKVGSGNLFQTAGLAAIGGAGQGAGNTAYDPTAAAGVIAPKKDDTDANKESIF